VEWASGRTGCVEISMYAVGAHRNPDWLRVCRW
jgi:hypothetical protein